MAASSVSYTGDGTTTTYPYTLGALIASHLSVTVDGELVPSDIQQLVTRRSYSVSLATAPALDAEIVISRSTPTNARVQHYSSATFDRNTPDESFLHRLFILQEALDNFTNSDEAIIELAAELQDLAVDTLTAIDMELSSITPDITDHDTRIALLDIIPRLCELEKAIAEVEQDLLVIEDNCTTLEDTFPYILTGTGLVGYWPLNEDVDHAGLPSLVDYSGNDNHLASLGGPANVYTPDALSTVMAVPDSLDTTTVGLGEHIGGVSPSVTSLLTSTGKLTVSCAIRLPTTYPDQFADGGVNRSLNLWTLATTDSGAIHSRAGVPSGLHTVLGVTLHGYTDRMAVSVYLPREGSVFGSSIFIDNLGLDTDVLGITVSLDNTTGLLRLTVNDQETSFTNLPSSFDYLPEGIPLQMVLGLGSGIPADPAIDTHVQHLCLFDGVIADQVQLNQSLQYEQAPAPPPLTHDCPLYPQVSGGDPYIYNP